MRSQAQWFTLGALFCLAAIIPVRFRSLGSIARISHGDGDLGSVGQAEMSAQAPHNGPS